MTWQRRHCIQCAGYFEECDVCGCHDTEGVGTQAKPPEVWDNVGANKAAPAGNRGLTTDCVGVEMAEANSIPMTGSIAARLDGCPRCVENSEVPFGAFNTPSGLIALYKCTDCGHRWHTAWHKEAAA